MGIFMQLVEHFFQSMANTSGMTLHIRQVINIFFVDRPLNMLLYMFLNDIYSINQNRFQLL